MRAAAEVTNGWAALASGTPAWLPAAGFTSAPITKSMLLGCQPERLHPHLLRRPRRQLLQLRLPPPLQLRRRQLLLLRLPPPLQLRRQQLLLLQLQHLLQLLVLLPRQLPPRPRQPRLQPLRRRQPGQPLLPDPTAPRGGVP